MMSVAVVFAIWLASMHEFVHTVKVRRICRRLLPRLCDSIAVRGSGGATAYARGMSDPHIGTLREKPLHASLKEWCAQPGDSFEQPVDGFVIDVVSGDMLIEVQTRSFSSMKRKLVTLLDLGHRIRVVHPIAIDKWIVKIDDDGTESGRRRSPRHGAPTDLFSELVSFPDLVSHPYLDFLLVMTIEEELRRHDPSKAWRRKGWVVQERRLLDIRDTLILSDPSDLAGLLPAELPQEWTTADLASALGRPRRIAQQMAYCLRGCDVAVPIGKQGNAVVYRTDGSARERTVPT